MKLLICSCISGTMIFTVIIERLGAPVSSIVGSAIFAWVWVALGQLGRYLAHRRSQWPE